MADPISLERRIELCIGGCEDFIHNACTPNDPTYVEEIAKGGLNASKSLKPERVSQDCRRECTNEQDRLTAITEPLLRPIPAYQREAVSPPLAILLQNMANSFAIDQGFMEVGENCAKKLLDLPINFLGYEERLFYAVANCEKYRRSEAELCELSEAEAELRPLGKTKRELNFVPETLTPDEIERRLVAVERLIQFQRKDLLSFTGIDDAETHAVTSMIASVRTHLQRGQLGAARYLLASIDGQIDAYASQWAPHDINKTVGTVAGMGALAGVVYMAGRNGAAGAAVSTATLAKAAGFLMALKSAPQPPETPVSPR